MIGTKLYNFMTSLNGGATIDLTLAGQLVDTAKTLIEEERPWLVLRKTDSSKTISTDNTWETAIDLSTITDFSNFYGDTPIKIFDGNNTIQYYNIVPFEKRLEYKDTSNTFVYDENAKKLYLNGTINNPGKLYIDYLATTTSIDLESTSNVWTEFPLRYAPLLAFYAIGVYKGAIDYDSINKQMLPENRFVMESLKNSLEKWDNDKQILMVENSDPTNNYNGFRNGAINIYDD